MRFPHCDARILHAPGACEHCDRSGLQRARSAWGIAYSGEAPTAGQVPCPADAAVAAGERGDYNRWPGNTPDGYRWPTPPIPPAAASKPNHGKAEAHSLRGWLRMVFG